MSIRSRPRHLYQLPLPEGYWSRRANRIAFMRWLDDLQPGRAVVKWRRLGAGIFAELGAEGLLQHHDGSVQRAVEEYLEVTGGGLDEHERRCRLELYQAIENERPPSLGELEREFYADVDRGQRTLH